MLSYEITGSEITSDSDPSLGDGESADSSHRSIYHATTQLGNDTVDPPESKSLFEQTGINILRKLQTHSTANYNVQSVFQHGLDGGYHRTYVADLLLLDSTTKKAVFHFPVIPSEEEIKGQVALLSYLRQENLPFQIPKVLEYDLREKGDNPLEHPYLMLSYISGERLENVLHTLTLSQRLQVTEQVIRITKTMEDLDFPVSGRIIAGIQPPDSLPYPATPQTSIHVAGYQNSSKPVDSLETLIDVGLDGMEDNGLGYIALQYDAADDTSIQGNAGMGPTMESNDVSSLDDPATETSEVDARSRLELAKRYLSDLGYLAGSQYEPMVLHHGDITPRNLLVRFMNNDGREAPSHDEAANIEITAVINWDEATIISRIVTRDPRAWLWETRDTEQGEAESHARYSDESRTIKAFFDLEVEHALPGYLEDAYGNGWWVRWLCKHLLRGDFGSNEDLEQFDKLERTWKQAQISKSRSTSELKGSTDRTEARGKPKRLVDRITDGSKWVFSKICRPST